MRLNRKLGGERCKCCNILTNLKTRVMSWTVLERDVSTMLDVVIFEI